MKDVFPPLGAIFEEDWGFQDIIPPAILSREEDWLI